MPPVKGFRVEGRKPVDSSAIKTPEYDVTARATDPYVEPFKDNGTAQVLGTLSKFIQAGGQLGGQLAATAREEGQRDSLAGKPKDPGVMESAYVAGYDTITGEHNANEYRRETWAWLANNRDKPEAEFKAGLNEIRAKYLASNVSDDALDGFLPKAVAADDDIQKRYLEYQTGIAIGEMHEKARQNMDTFYRDALTSALNSVGIPSIESLNTPEGWDAFETRRTPIMNTLLPALRGALTGYQEKYKGVMSRAQVSEMTVEILAGLAVTTGRPEILNFAYMKDSQGRTLTNYNDTKGNPLGPTIEAAQIKAEDRGIKMRNYIEEKTRRAEKDFAEAEAQGIVSEARQLWKNTDTQPEALAVLRERVEALSNSPGATPSLINDLWMIVDTAEKRRNHPAQSLIDVRTALSFKYATGNLKVRDVSAARWELSEGDYDKLLGHAQEQEEQERNRQRSGEDAYFTPRNNVHIAYDRFFPTINPKNAITGLFYDKQGNEKARDAQRMFQREIVNYQSTHGGKSPDIDALEAIEVKVYKKYEPYVKLKPEQFEALKKKMIEEGRMPKNAREKYLKWSTLSTREREVADQVVPDLGSQ